MVKDIDFRVILYINLAAAKHQNSGTEISVPAAIAIQHSNLGEKASTPTPKDAWSKARNVLVGDRVRIASGTEEHRDLPRYAVMPRNSDGLLLSLLFPLCQSDIMIASAPLSRSL